MLLKEADMTKSERELVDERLLSACFFPNLSALLSDALVVMNGEATLPHGTRLLVVHDKATETLQWLWSPTMTVSNVVAFQVQALRGMLDGLIRALEWKILRAMTASGPESPRRSALAAKRAKEMGAMLVRLKEHRDSKLMAAKLKLD